MNGKSWPYTEKLMHTIGDTVRWRCCRGEEHAPVARRCRDKRIEGIQQQVYQYLLNLYLIGEHVRNCIGNIQPHLHPLISRLGRYEPNHRLQKLLHTYTYK